MPQALCPALRSSAALPDLRRFAFINLRHLRNLRIRSCRSSLRANRMPEGTGKLLIVLGLALVVVGVLFQFSGRLPWLGRLPGDISIQRENFSIYFPITTSILVSVVLSLLFWLFRR
jgi:hypothetical protein